MTAGNKAVKVTAKTILKHNILRSAITSFIVIFSVLICQLLGQLLAFVFSDILFFVFLAVSFVFLLAPLFLGFLRFFWRMMFNAKDMPVTVFYYFSCKELYLKALKFIFSILLKLLICVAVLFLPVLIVYLISSGYIFELLNIQIPSWTANFNAILIFLAAISFLILLFIMLKYYIAPILFVADDNMDISEALNMSAVISKKTHIDFSYLLFSFLGWILLSFLIILNFLIVPYILVSYAVHTRFAIAEFNLFLEKNYKTTDNDLFESEI